jgi:hypothetical protein
MDYPVRHPPSRDGVHKWRLEHIMVSERGTGDTRNEDVYSGEEYEQTENYLRSQGMTPTLMEVLAYIDREVQARLDRLPSRTDA